MIGSDEFILKLNHTCPGSLCGVTTVGEGKGLWDIGTLNVCISSSPSSVRVRDLIGTAGTEESLTEATGEPKSTPRGECIAWKDVKVPPQGDRKAAAGLV